MKTRFALCSAILSVLMIVSVLISCGESSDQTSKSDAQAQTAADSAADQTPEETTTERMYPDLPAADYGGTVFDILTTSNWANSWTEIYDYFSEQENGEPINDMVFRRNRAVEEQYNVVINEVNHMGSDKGGNDKNGAKILRNSVMAGDNAFDACQIGSVDVATLAYEGYLLELKSEVPNLNISNPWWDQPCIKDVSIYGKTFYATGDISTLDNDTTFCYIFNKKLIEQYGMENPYELVRDGKWTNPKFAEMVVQVSEDLNGDGKFDENDRYGFCIWHEAMRSLVHGVGCRFCDLDDKGELVLTLNDPKVATAVEQFSKAAYDRSIAFSIYHSGDLVEPMFAADQILFHNRYLCMIKKYRNMDSDFGIVPVMKFDEAQDTYYSTISSYGCAFICVPTTVEKLEMTGTILEAMACESMYTVTPAYYDITLQGKNFRDNDSSEMLDIILANRVFDLGMFYAVGDYYTHIMELFYKSSTDFASMYEKYLPKAEKKLAEINEAFAELG